MYPFVMICAYMIAHIHALISTYTHLHMKSGLPIVSCWLKERPPIVSITFHNQPKSTDLSIYRSICRSMGLWISLSIHLSICECPSVHWLIYPSIYPSIHQSIYHHLSICPSIRFCISPSIRPSIYPFVHLSSRTNFCFFQLPFLELSNIQPVPSPGCCKEHLRDFCWPGSTAMRV